jgi:hypothetical protein
MLKPAAETAILSASGYVAGRHLVASHLPNQPAAGERTMKAFMIATAILALIAMPAQAQMGGKHHGDDKKADQPTKKVDEKAYKAALERIPDPKEKYDPWGVARPADTAKKTK